MTTSISRSKKKNDRALNVKHVNLKMTNELFDLIAREADDKNLPVSELIVRQLAEKNGRLDLAYVPRKRLGRPRKETAEN